MRRHEQRAAVLVGDYRRLERAQLARLIDDLILVHADQRPHDRERRRLLDHRHVLERLRRDLAKTLARHQHGGLRSFRQRARDSQHEAPIEHDPQRAQSVRDDLALQISKRYQHQRRSQLPSRQMRRELGRLFLARLRYQRMRVEMHEIQAQPATHHAIGRDRRVDPARQQRHPASRDANRQSARARHFAGGHVRGVVHYLDRNRQLGRAQIDFEAERFLHFAANRAIDFDRSSSRNRLSSRLVLTANVRALLPVARLIASREIDSISRGVE